MREQSRSAARFGRFAFVALALAYVAWAARFIAETSVETSAGRYFCLFDDAMVSLRYAWNLAHGNGLVWNPGERVEGTTCFLFTLLMSVGAFLFDKSLAALFVQIAGIALVLCVALLARALTRSLGATPGLGWVAAAGTLAYYPLSYWSLMGMETGFLTALSLAALLVAVRRASDSRGSMILGLLLGLTFATRPDAAMPAVAILAFRAGWILRRHRQVSALVPWLVELMPFVAIAAGLTLFRLVYYGSALPNTYDLKMGGWPLWPRLENGWKFVKPFIDASGYLFIVALASVACRRDGRRLLALCYAGCVFAVQIWVGGDAWPYWRLLVPAVIVLIVLAVDAAGGLMGWLVRPERPGLTFGFALVCLAGALWDANRPFERELRLEVPPYKVHLNRRSVKVGLELSRYADPRAAVAVMAAGTVPYYSGLRGVDVLGKSDRHVARLPPRGVGSRITPGHNKYDLWYSIDKLRPDVIYDGLAWARHEPGILEVVAQNYVAAGAFWFRRDSPHVRWNVLP